MRTIIAGSRCFSDIRHVCEATTIAQNKGFEISCVVSGCAHGVDKLGEQYAKENGLPVARYPADWKTHGRKAGYLRNRQMAENADALIAVWDGTSRGTRMMIDIATSLGLRVYVHQCAASQSRV